MRKKLLEFLQNRRPFRPTGVEGAAICKFPLKTKIDTTKEHLILVDD
jgi:hypothetical protein